METIPEEGSVPQPDAMETDEVNKNQEKTQPPESDADRELTLLMRLHHEFWPPLSCHAPGCKFRTRMVSQWKLHVKFSHPHLKKRKDPGSKFSSGPHRKAPTAPRQPTEREKLKHDAEMKKLEEEMKKF